MSASDEVKAYFREVERELRGARGWQSEAARRVNIHRSVVNKVIRGVMSPGASIVARVRLARAGSTPSRRMSTDGVVATFRDGEHASGIDPEARAISVLAALPSDVRARVLRYAAERWGEQ